MLHDIHDDPDQLHNLADDPALAAVQANLSGRMAILEMSNDPRLTDALDCLPHVDPAKAGPRPEKDGRRPLRFLPRR